MNKIDILPKDTSFLDNEKGSGCHYTTQEIADQKTFVWKIKNWSEIQNQKKILSEEFEVGKNKWKILLFPNGIEGNGAVALFLYSVNANMENCSPQWYCCSHFSLAIANPKDEKLFVIKDAHHRFNKKENDWGFKTFIRTTDLEGIDEDSSRPILNNNKFKIIAYVRVIKDTTGVLWYDFSEWDSKQRTGFVGLKNQGATCYMNSLLQSLYFINPFRKATFEIPTENDKPTESVPLALQRIFYNLQHSNVAVDTCDLTSSFGWDIMELFMQHDIQEFNRVLQDNLEDKMKKTKAEGVISNLFKGKMKSYIKCVDVEYTSSRIEDYYDIQLNVKGCKDVLQSFDEYIDVETLDGDNKYMAEGHGLQVAKKGVIFQSFPPVLQLHLKRFEYDIERDAMVKINDRYEYPETINLSKYLENYKQKDSKENEYVLYGVLVHSGDLNSGHYNALLRPNNNDKWFKFDDDNVYPISTNDVFEENFGGKSIYKANNKMVNRFVNAYMLTYLKKSEMNKLLSPFSEKDIPKYISDQIIKEQEAMQKHQQFIENERKSLMIFVVTDEIIEHHKGLDLFNINNNQYPITEIPSIKILKTATYKEFISELQKKYNYSVKDIRLWDIQYRPNNSIRINKIIHCDDDNKKMEELLNIRGESKHGPRCIYFYVEVADGNVMKAYNSPFLPFDQFPNQRLIFAKYFDIRKKTITKVKKITIKDVEKPIISCAPQLNEMAGLPVNTRLNIYEETYASMIDLIDQSQSFSNTEIQNGDILCFEEKISESDEIEDYMTIPKYFDNYRNQTMVTFRYYDIKENRDDIILNLSKNSTYEEISKKLGERIKQEPGKIQFITANQKQIGYSPKLRLYEIITNECLLYYKVLNIPLIEYESIIKIQVDVLNNKHQVQRSLYLQFPGNATFVEFYNEVFNKLEINPQSPERKKKLIYSTQNGTVTSIIEPQHILLQNCKPELYKFYVEDIPEEEINYNTLISIIYFENNINNTHGIPFLIKIKENETFGEMKERLLKRIPLTEKEISNDKIFFVNKNRKLFEISDDKVPYPEFAAIAFECIDKSRYHYPAEKGLKINN